jgi:hypothetical protein
VIFSWPSRGLFRHRASASIAMACGSAITIGAIGLAESFWAVIGLTVVWGLLFSATMHAKSAGIAALGLPFLALSRRRTAPGEGLGPIVAPAPQPA